jgi:hypothetical protein
MVRLMAWIESLGNAGAIANAGALAVERRQEDFAVRSLRRRLRQPDEGAAARTA